MTNWFWSTLLAGFGLIGLYLAGREDWRGWALGLVDEVLWIIYAITTHQWPFAMSAVAYGWVYARNLRAWLPAGAVIYKLDIFKTWRFAVMASRMPANESKGPPGVIVPMEAPKSLSVDPRPTYCRGDLSDGFTRGETGLIVGCVLLLVGLMAGYVAVNL